MGTNGVALAPEAFLQLAGHPLRWRILGDLARSDRTVGELTDLAGHPQNLVSYHLGKLRAADLVSARRSSADRRDSYYTVDLTRLAELLDGTGEALHPGLRRGPAPERAIEPAPARVLFLCTGNSARSQIAEALLIERSGHTVDARSAGSHPKPLHDNAVRVMAERGLDIAGNTTKHLRLFARMRFDRVITLCDKVREICPDFPAAAATAHWSIADPAAEGETDDATHPAFRHVADELEARVDLLVAELVARPTERTSHAR